MGGVTLRAEENYTFRYAGGDFFFSKIGGLEMYAYFNSEPPKSFEDQALI